MNILNLPAWSVLDTREADHDYHITVQLSYPPRREAAHNPRLPSWPGERPSFRRANFEKEMKMIVGCYTVHLYCDAEGHKGMFYDSGKYAVEDKDGQYIELRLFGIPC